MLDSCEFEFDRPDPVYYSGETINGSIKFRTIKTQAIRDIFIDFRGEAIVRWEERKARQSDGLFYIEEFCASETYLHLRSLVVRECQLHAGTHIYPFCIPLPEQCPTSCIEIYGQIRYVLSLMIHRSLTMNNAYKQPLMVLQQLNLNLHSEYWLPLKNEVIKNFCCWPCASGPVISTLSIPLSGYAPGQQIKYTLEIDNQSTNYDLYGITVDLIQTYKFIARLPYLKVLKHSNVLAQTQQQHEHFLRLTKRLVVGTLTIPPVPPSSQNSGIITVRYSLKMSISTGPLHRDSKIVLPITIGTVPLTTVAIIPTDLAGHPWTHLLENSASTAKPPSYDNYMPPSFEEATSTINQSANSGNMSDGFLPKYPMYTSVVPTAPPAAVINGSNM